MGNYLCSRCGRGFSYEETVSFCPFCGTAYSAAAAPVNAASGTMRIVIGSDSERTIQERYWRDSKASLYSFMDTLYSFLPDVVKNDVKEETSGINEETFSSCFRSLRRNSSATALKRQLDKYINQLQEARRPETPAPREPWNMDALEEEIDDACMQMAEVLGSMDAWRMKPELQYDPDEINEEIDEEAEESEEVLNLEPEDRQVLMEAVEEVRRAIYRLIDEHSTYALFSDTRDVFEEETLKLSPVKLAKKLIMLSKKDYDPFFGESFEEFVRTFWQALCLLHKSAETHVQTTREDIRENIQRRALCGLIHNWYETLDRQVDKAYQEQQMDMMNLCQEMTELRSEIEKRMGDS